MVRRLGSVQFSVTRHLRAPRRLELKGPQSSSSASPPTCHRRVEAQRGHGVHPPVPGISAGRVEETRVIQATGRAQTGKVLGPLLFASSY